MNEHDDSQSPVTPDAEATDTPTDGQETPGAPVAPLTGPPTTPPTFDPLAADATQVTTKRRLRDRTFTFRSTLAVALAGLVLGAGSGIGVAAIAGHEGHHEGGRYEMRGPGGDRGFPGPGGFGDGQGHDRRGPAQNGQIVPPGTAPQQQEDSSGGTSQAPSSS